MNPPTELDDVVAGYLAPPPPGHRRTQPRPRFSDSNTPPAEPPSARIASGLFEEHPRPNSVEVLLRTAPTRRKKDWAAGYASHRAATSGPTTLITMEPGTLRIQLHSAGRRIPLPPDPIRTRVDWALSWIAWFGRTTVVVPAEQDQIGAYLDWDVPIHLMTESINTRLVETYQWVKRLHTRCIDRRAKAPVLDLVMIDAPDAIARLCARSLEKTSHRFLSRSLPTDCIIERMPEATPAVELDFDLEPGYGCDQVLEALDCRQHDRRQGRLGSPFG